MALLVTAGLMVKKARIDKLAKLTAGPTTEQKIQDKFGGITIPQDVDKADLKDISGESGLGMVTRKYSDGKFEITILADIPAPSAGYFYQGWILKDDSAFLSLGKLGIAKGGFILDFTSAKDYSDYKKVVVTLEKTLDQSPEKSILEGSY